ncbi:MAG: hypothetical protein M5T61_19160 [Acidimicrobiia bacterium]|nr:hypothetical protein [Acidimicrobiia bacterium]
MADLQNISAFRPGNERDDLRLTRKEISRIVYNWIGVDGGYLGSFSYASHDRFWLEVCDQAVSTGSFSGTTRECFEATLLTASAKDQVLVLRAILDDYPPLDAPDPSQPRFRTEKLHREILSWISRIETGTTSVEVGLRDCRAWR